MWERRPRNCLYGRLQVQKSNILFTAALIALAVCLICGQVAAVHTVDKSTMTNKVLCGYQGWHCCPGDGNSADVGWFHWSESTQTIGPGYYHTEVWPQTSE